MFDDAELPSTALPAFRVTTVSRLSPALAVLTATVPAMPVSVLVDGRPAPRPQLTVRFAAAGRTDLLVLLRLPGRTDGGGTVALLDSEGRCRCEAALPAEPGDPERLLAVLRALEPRDRARALRALFDTGPAMFRVQGDAGVVAALSGILDGTFPPPGGRAPMTAGGAGFALCQGLVPAGLGPIETVVAVGRGRIWRSPFGPLVRGGGATVPFDLMVPVRAPDGPPQALLLFGAGGVCCRRVPASTPARLLAALTARGGGVAPATRQYIHRTLAAAGGLAAASLLRDAQLYAPAAPVEVRRPTEPVGVGVDLAVGRDIGGLFVAGWLHDPYGAVERVTALAADGSRRAVDRFAVRFPRSDVEQAYAGGPHAADGGGSGFAAFLSGGPAFPAFQHTFEVALRSGGVLTAVPPLAATTPRQARQRILAAVPPERLTPAVIADLLATPVRALQRALRAARRPPEVVAFGCPPAAPTASLVIPLYRNLDYLRFQYAAFALDPAMAAAELIFVLDSPEQRVDLEHFLRCLERLYGLPCRLAVMGDNAGFAAACNSGAALARGATLVFVNSDVLPVAPGWMAPLHAVLEARRDVAAVGPKLLFDDQSLQHAGLYFDRDYQGRWYNHHYFKGLPRDFAPACRARLVPGVTAATLMIRRGVFEDVGGFCEDYVIGDFEDSDLCLKLRSAGHEIAYAPEAELFHYERRSIETHEGYTKTAAGLYNQWLHASRWSGLMEEVMGRALPPLDGPAVAAARRADRP
ncbi:glycosyltransferase [Azospirillum sp. ST 5-10]|uniref:glycosyltransferase n=1 Tax=unclassified Azospirillum TaxID=2630922 RepID=UPI003F4A4135